METNQNESTHHLKETKKELGWHMDGMMEEKKGFRLDQTRDTTSL